MNARKANPFKWPFPPGSKRKAPKRPAQTRSPHASSFSRNRKGMLADVVMVVFWGASIPGFMWLGAVSGF